VLTIRQVSRSFREGGVVHRVLDGVDARVDGGEAVAILGRSGSGKSTLLNLISGIDHPDSGSIELDGQQITQLGEPARTLFRRSRIGFVYQFFNLIPTLDVEENVRLVLELNGIRGAEARRRSLAMLGQVGLAERAHSAVDKLSGGEQQRVAIARALVHEPSLLLADEPTGNLDSINGEAVMALLRELHQNGSTICMVTHDPRYAGFADRSVHMFDGKIGEQVAAHA
jgi:putative ABC transport system ATP-binding protein